MGSSQICKEVYNTVKTLRKINPKIIYLCDPVMGDKHCYVKQEVVEFFTNNLQADIISPNKYEAELLANTKINSVQDINVISNILHKKFNVSVVIITGIEVEEFKNKLVTSISTKTQKFIGINNKLHSDIPLSGTGDLFSALFLGRYLRTNNIVLALKYAIYFLHNAIDQSLEMKSKELQILSQEYKNFDKSKYVEIIPI
jgi:pyridoxine kinase